MKKIIEDVVSFPNGCETVRFTACLVSMLMCARKETGEKKHEQLYLSLRHRGNGELPPVLCTTDNVLLKKNYINPLDIPEIEKRTSFVSLNDVEINIDEKKFNAHVLATDTLFLQLLDYPVLEGDRARLLADPKEAVITSRFAQKLFGKENPVGKNIEYNGNILTIKGITGKTETQSSLNFDGGLP